MPPAVLHQRARRSSQQTNLRIGSALPWIAGAALAAGLGALSTVSPGIALAFALGAAGVVVLALAPPMLLPFSALIMSAVIPVQVIKIAFGGVPFALWLLRAQTRRPQALTRALAAAAGVWAVASFAAAPLHRLGGITWLLAFLVGIIAPLVYSMPAVSMRLRRTYVWFAAIVAGYGIIEKWILHSNPLYGHLLAGDPSNPVLQIWSSYRATTIIGQPLINATIFGPALILALDDYLRRDDATGWTLMQAALLTGGLVATVSRGPTVAVGVGIALLLALRQRGKGRLNWRILLVTCALAAASFVVIPTLIARSDSVEGRGSLLQRSFLIQDTELALSHSYLFGVGPGEAEDYRETRDLPRSGTALESMYAQVLVELGIPGVLLFVAAVASVALPALRRADQRGAAVALLVMMASLGTFDSLESRQNLMIILGFFLCLVGPTRSRPRRQAGSNDGHDGVTSYSNTDSPSGWQTSAAR